MAHMPPPKSGAVRPGTPNARTAASDAQPGAVTASLPTAPGTEQDGWITVAPQIKGQSPAAPCGDVADMMRAIERGQIAARREVRRRASARDLVRRLSANAGGIT